MSKTVTIPNYMRPKWECRVNGALYKYPAGTVQEVPDEVANVIENYYAAQVKPENNQNDLASRVTALEERVTALENPPSTITFDVDGTEYTAEEGMTWAELIESEYNYESCTCGSGCKQFAGDEIVAYMAGDCDGIGYQDLYDNGTNVTTDAEIKVDYAYSIDPTYVSEGSPDDGGEEESGTYQSCGNCGWNITSDFTYEECPDCGEPL